MSGQGGGACGNRVGSRPWWMSSDQYDPCHCLRAKDHEGECQCEHTFDETARVTPPADPEADQ